VVLYSVDY